MRLLRFFCVSSQKHRQKTEEHECHIFGNKFNWAGEKMLTLKFRAPTTLKWDASKAKIAL